MTISELDIKDDKLAMFDGKGVNANVLGEYTGEMRRRKRSSGAEPMQSTGNVMVIKFTTNGINQGNGFIMEYEGREVGSLPRSDVSHTEPVPFIAAGCALLVIVIIAVIALKYRKKVKRCSIHRQASHTRTKESPEYIEIDDISPRMHTDDHLYRFLRDLGAERFADKFAEEGITYDELFNLTDSNLNEMDIPIGLGQRILNKIRTLWPPPPHPGPSVYLTPDLEISSSSDYLEPRYVDADDDHHTAEPIYDTIEDVPIKYLCPITENIMNDPVTATDGITYERTNVTGKPISVRLVPNISLQKEIQKFTEKRDKKLKK
ncbi:uncharacterized protein LOC144434205 [Glandiceps talaboti]